jgi:dTDP-4-dehydrorhamnose reductase
LVHVSTDFVFGGKSDRPYRADDPVNPLSAYGRSKLLGETELQKYAPENWLIVRTAWVYGRHGVNFPRTMVTAARAGKPLSVVSDQVGSPTYTVDLAWGILELLDHGGRGIYQLTNSGETNWFEFAKAALAGFGVEHPVSAITSADWQKARPNTAARPSYSVLDMEPFTKLTGKKMRPWREGLSAFCREVGTSGF